MNGMTDFYRYFCLMLVLVDRFAVFECDLTKSDCSSGHRKLSKLYAKVKTPIAILGAPFSKGQSKTGTELAPNMFRKQNLINQIKRLGYESVIDYGDLGFVDDKRDNRIKSKNNFTQLHNQFTLGMANKHIERKVAEILRKGETLVVLGGDHSLTAGVILGNAKVAPDVCVLYVDGHGDLNTCESTTSGNFHGMPLSFVINEMKVEHKNFTSCPGMKVLKPRLPAAAIGLMALRDLDDNELDLINKYKIRHYSMKDIDVIGIAEAVSQMLSTVCGQKSKIHVSFDIDSVDPIYTPNTGTTVSGGLTVREALQMAEMIAATNKLSVVSMYEVNPAIGPKHMAVNTVNVAMNLILAFLGKARDVYWAQPWTGGWGKRKDH